MSSLLALSIRGVRAFDSKTEQTIEFKKPLTVILGPNGCGKTTVIECLRFATTGQLPPGSMSGKAFVHDCKVEETTEVKASVKLLFEIAPGGNRYMSVRNMQLSQKKKTSTFKQIDGVLRHIPMEGGVRGTSPTISGMGVGVVILVGLFFEFSFCLFVFFRALGGERERDETRRERERERERERGSPYHLYSILPYPSFS